MTTSTVTPEIAKFAQGVRAALADLPSDEVDDLTDGLEADLAEAYAEDLQRELPDPSAYATELRLAAGLPARSRIRHGVWDGIGDSLRDTRRDLAIAIRRNPMLSGIVDFLGTLRPVWWVLRAWLATWLVAAFFGSEQGFWFNSFGWVMLLAAFIVVSVQLGLGRWGGRTVATFVLIGNVVAIMALPIVRAAADNAGGGYDGSFDDGYSAGADSVLNDRDLEGLAFNGQPLENIYVYDSAGKPLHGVQLFDVDGKPLETIRDSVDLRVKPQPTKLETGTLAFNVFPLNLDWMTTDDNGEPVVDPSPDPDKAKAFKNGPFIKVPAVQKP